MSPDSDLPEINEGDSDYPDFHRSTRMPLDAVVRLHFEGTVAYQNGFAANVSATGMYVKHPDPPPLGTRLVFELVLGEDRKPVQGAGVVAWSREKYEGPGRPAGIGIQFTEIDALSRQHIAESLFAFLETQLGDELAEDPDVAELVATSTSKASPELLESIARFDDQPTPAGRTTPPKGTPVPSAPERSPATSFRIFEESSPSSALSSDVLAGDGLFTPAIPPDEPVDLRRAGSRRAKSPWPAVVVGVAVAAGGFTAWWFLAGPGSLGEPAPVVAAPRPRSEPATPPRPTLDPQPGTATTLAQTVGAEAAAPEPLPVDASRASAAGPEAATEDSPAIPEESAAAVAPPPVEIVVAGSTPDAATAKRASRVVSIDWEESNGLTVVVISGDAPFPAGSFKWNEIRDENPRVLVRFNRMSAGLGGKPVLAAGTPELRQVRTGYHERPEGNEQHVVLDLAGKDVRVESVEANGSRLYIKLAKP